MSLSAAVERMMAGRDFLAPAPDLDGKTILVTGGTGSFGQRFVGRVLAEHRPKKLIVFSRDELKQYEMAARFPTAKHPCLRYFLGDVRDPARLEMAMRDVDVVVHAAALKQVPAAEYNPFECIQTNVIGAQNVVTAALRRNVKQIVALSTDKAANPINLYGASKLASDKIFIAANNLAGENGAKICVVRYGNVIGSRGSVLPLFERLLAEGADHLPITDPRMTRFWITLDQGVSFVLSSLALSQSVGAEIFVPKLPSMTMADLARACAPHLPHRVIGIRPGEKLHEVMIPEDEARSTVELADRYVILPAEEAERRAAYLAQGGAPVADQFRYASDANPERFDARALQATLAAAYPESGAA